jgi:hypothetical protein
MVRANARIDRIVAEMEAQQTQKPLTQAIGERFFSQVAGAGFEPATFGL